MKREYLKDYTLNEIQGFYVQGIVSQSDYEWYCYHWRNSVFRYSNELINYEDKNYKGFSLVYPI